MKPIPLSILLLLTLLGATPSFAQARPTAQDPRPEDAARKMDVRSRELDEASREMDVRSRGLALDDQKSRVFFEAEMRNLILLEKRMALDQASRFTKGRPPMCPPFACGPQSGRCPILCPWGFLAFCAAIHLLLAWWVSSDIRQRKVGSRIWVLMALLTGLIGTFVYAVVRLGDRPVP